MRERPAACVALLVVLSLVCAALTFLPQPHTGGDNAAYVTLARSLLENGTYTELWDPATPPHTKYPPAFPVMIAAGMVAGLQPWAPLKVVVIVLSAVAVAFSFLWIRARRRALLALGVGIVLAIAPGVLREGHWLLSDVPFWAFTMIALWAFERLRPDDWRRFAIAALATLVAYFTRSAGLPLVLAAFVWLAWRRRWTQFGVLAAVIGVPAILWFMRGRAYGPSGYTSEFWLVDPYIPELGRIGIGDLFVRIAHNGWKYVSVHMPILLTDSVTSVVVLLCTVLFVLALTGWLRCVRAPHVADLFLPLYLGLIAVWPAVWSGERFLLPVLPLLLYYAGVAASWIANRFAPRRDLVVVPAMIAVLLAFALPGLVRAARISRDCVAIYRAGERLPCLGNPVWDEFFDIAEMTSQALPDGAVVISRKPRLFYAIGGSRGRIYPFSQDPAAFFAAADSAGARYVVYDRIGSTADVYLGHALVRKPEAFCILHVTPVTSTVLFGIRADHAAVPDRGEAALNDADAPGFPFCDVSYWRNAEAMQTFGGT